MSHPHGDCLVACLDFLPLPDVLGARGVSRSWRDACVHARGEELAWLRAAVDVGSIARVEGVNPHHLYVESPTAAAPSSDGATLVLTDDRGGRQRVGFPCACRPTPPRTHWWGIDTDTWWFCASGRRVFQLAVDSLTAATVLSVGVLPRCDPGRCGAITAVPPPPPPSLVRVVPDVDALFGGSVVDVLVEHNAILPFVGVHRPSNTILIRIGDRAATVAVGADLSALPELQCTVADGVPHPLRSAADADLPCLPESSTRTFAYTPEQLAVWRGVDSCVYIATRTSLLLMSSVAALEVPMADPRGAVRLPGLCYGVGFDGVTLYGTRNYPRRSTIDCRGADGEWGTLREWDVEQLNEIVLSRRTRARLFLQDVAVGRRAVTVVVCPAGTFPPAALLTVSLREPGVLLSRIVFDAALPRPLGYHPFDFSKNALDPPFYAIKLWPHTAAARVGVTMVLPLPTDPNAPEDPMRYVTFAVTG